MNQRSILTQAYRDRHKSLGLCICCPRVAMTGKQHCSLHNRLIRQAAKERRELYRKNGLCPHCKQPLKNKK